MKVFARGTFSISFLIKAAIFAVLFGIIVNTAYRFVQVLLVSFFHMRESIADPVTSIFILLLVALLLSSSLLDPLIDKFVANYNPDKTQNRSVLNSINRFPLQAFRSDLMGRIERIDAADMKDYDGSEMELALSSTLEDLKLALRDKKTSTMNMLAIKGFIEALEKMYKLT
ncbi:MAG: hypothetical protein NT136_02980 [Candidatus Moranbacteria bacterium]|nr:hypothetical protein [Candidatus Moranbacteria bacterium]